MAEVHGRTVALRRRFSNVPDRLKYPRADTIFSPPNDLVVDVNSVNQLGIDEPLGSG